MAQLTHPRVMGDGGLRRQRITGRLTKTLVIIIVACTRVPRVHGEGEGEAKALARRDRR